MLKKTLIIVSDMSNPVITMRDIVLEKMHEQEKSGTLSAAHSYDHVENVSRYAGIFASYLAKRFDTDPNYASAFAEMDGWAHDIIRYASEVESGEDASARFLESLYETHFSKSINRDDYQNLVVGIIRNSDQSFERMAEIYKDNKDALVIALALVAGDKLIEASGPRVLERRSYFVGKERMLNSKDLGAVFKYPNESANGVLSETFVRLGDINHVSNYSSDKSLLSLAQKLHSLQYQLYKGLLLNLGMTEEEALGFIVDRMSEKLPKLAERVKRGGKRLVDERHMDGTYFSNLNLTILSNAIKSMPDDEDLKESSSALVSAFSLAESPEFAIEAYKSNPYDLPTFRNWMEGIIAYRKGTYVDELLKNLDSQ